jgi:Glycosyl transferase family 2
VSLRIHALVLALNEEVFITNLLNTLYPFCSGISVLTQYDRDWYGKRVQPDRTLEAVANHDDPEGKIHLVLRRWRSQPAALNCEIGALSSRAASGVLSHGTPIPEIHSFHRTPDYFWIVDADEFYDPESIPAMLEFLERRRPRGMRVHGYNYVGTWNRRVPMHVVSFCQFGFVRAGLRFKSRRRGVTWKETVVSRLLRAARLPDFSASLFGFIECPKDVAVFHHGCWIGDRTRLVAKATKSTHTDEYTPEYPDEVARLPYDWVPVAALPFSITEGRWPENYFDAAPPAATPLANAAG